MNKRYNVAIVGATEIVGEELLRMLEERDFPVEEMRLIAAGEAADRFLDFRGEELLVGELTDQSFEGVDIAFFGGDAECSRTFCPVAAGAGAVCVDTSSAWRMDPEVPLLVPEVNPQEIDQFRNKGIIASPGSTTIQLVLPLKALHDASPLRRVVISTYQAVSGRGEKAVEELRIQCGELLNGRPAESTVFPHQIAFNCLPQVGALLEDGYSAEEAALIAETRKVLGEEALGVTATTVQVPVFYGHCESVNVETAEKIDPARARELFSASPGLALLDDPASQCYPMPIAAAGEDLVSVGRIREDRSIGAGLHLWVVADNLRKGAATNAVQIAELLAARHL